MIRVQMIWFSVLMMTGNSNCGKGNFDEIERKMGNGDDVNYDQDDVGVDAGGDVGDDDGVDGGDRSGRS